MCLDKTWASGVPGVALQCYKTMWMFLEYPGMIPLIACMTKVRYASSALAKDEAEAIHREYELRSWLRRGLSTERKDFGYTSAQVSWLSSRDSRHRDRLVAVGNMLSITRDDLDTYKTLADMDDIDIFRKCITNLADEKASGLLQSYLTERLCHCTDHCDYLTKPCGRLTQGAEN